MACSFDGCDRTAKGRKWCVGHQKQRTDGRPLSVLGSAKAPRPVTADPIDPDTSIVPLTGGRTALISSVDAEKVGRSRWWFKKGTKGEEYAHGYRHGRRLRLHQFIGSLAGIEGELIDHKNGNGLDCRRDNLRPATTQQNNSNARLRTDNVTGRKGVGWNSHTKKWRGRVRHQGKLHERDFDRIEDASAFAREMRERLHREFANHG